MRTVETIVRCNTVRALLDELTAIAKNPELSGLLDASIESAETVFVGFKIVRRVLSDASEVLDFELLEDANQKPCSADCGAGKHVRNCPYALAVKESLCGTK